MTCDDRNNDSYNGNAKNNSDDDGIVNSYFLYISMWSYFLFLFLQALGCQDGTIAYYQLIFSTVHGLYKDRFVSGSWIYL